jgi:hypothetical protein
MSKDTSDANTDGATQESVESPSSASDFIRSALGGEEQPEVTESEVTEVETDAEESEEVETDVDVDEEVTDDEEGSDDILSQIDVEALDEEGVLSLGSRLAEILSPQQAALVAQAIGSKGGTEYGKMRSELKKAQQLNEDILSKINPSSSEFSSISDEGELDKTEAEIIQRLDYFQGKALPGDWDYDEDGNEGVKDASGKVWAKDVVVDGVKHMQKQLRELDRQRQSVREEQYLPKLEKAELEKAEGELPWMKDTESKLYKEYKKLTDDPSVELIKKLSPKVHAKFARLLAHAVNSMENAPTKKAFKLPLKKSGVKPIGSLASGTQTNQRSSGNKKLSAAQQNISSGKYGKSDVQALISSSL